MQQINKNEQMVAWCSGDAFDLINEVTPPGPVSTVMGDCLWAGKPSRYVTSHLG